jgi:hypothetical protein
MPASFRKNSTPFGGHCGVLRDVVRHAPRPKKAHQKEMIGGQRDFSCSATLNMNLEVKYIAGGTNAQQQQVRRSLIWKGKDKAECLITKRVRSTPPRG